MKLENDGAKYKEIDAVDFKCDIVWGTGEIKSIGTGDYYAFATDAEGNFVKYNADDATLTLHPWRYKDSSNYKAIHSQFKVGEEANSGKPIVVAFDYKAQNSGNQTWMATQLSFLGFSIYPNFQGNPSAKVTGVGLNNDSHDVVKKVPVGENTAAEDWHTVKCIISPTLADNRKAEMTAIEIDGVVTQLDNIYGSALDSDDKIFIQNIGARFMANDTDRGLEVKNLTVSRGVEDISVSSSVSDGATDIIPDSIKLNFSDDVELVDGAIKVYESGKEMTSGYTAVLGNDNKTVTVNIPDYKSRTAYKIVVDNTLVSGLLGGELKEPFQVNFVTSKKVAILEGTTENLAANCTITPRGYGGVGQQFTTMETDADGVTTITVNNNDWNKVKTNGTKGTESTPRLYYDLDGDGKVEDYGYSGWDWSKIFISGISDTENITAPIVISMDYAFENAGTNMMQFNMGGKMMHSFFPFGKKPTATVKGNWNGEPYASNVTEEAWHTVQYVIDPTLNTGRYTSLSQITLDGDIVVKGNSENPWLSYNALPEGTTTQLDSTIILQCNLVKTADSEGNYLPTVLKFKNLKIMRAKDLNIALDTDAVTNTENTLAVRFSDPVTEAELANLKVMKGAETVDNAITNISLAEDGLSAALSLSLDTTARYTLVTSEVTDIYGVKSSTEAIEFEYYNTSDGYVTIKEAAKADDGTNTTVSFTFTGTKEVSPLVIAAAYDDNMRLLGVNTKAISLYTSADVSDKITLEKVTGAARIQVMAWDSLENMMPYCMARDID